MSYPYSQAFAGDDAARRSQIRSTMQDEPRSSAKVGVAEGDVEPQTAERAAVDEQGIAALALSAGEPPEQYRVRREANVGDSSSSKDGVSEQQVSA
jgi:hypothetical protein